MYVQNINTNTLKLLKNKIVTKVSLIIDIMSNRQYFSIYIVLIFNKLRELFLYILRENMQLYSRKLDCDDSHCSMLNVSFVRCYRSMICWCCVLDTHVYTTPYFTHDLGRRRNAPYKISASKNLNNFQHKITYINN